MDWLPAEDDPDTLHAALALVDEALEANVGIGVDVDANDLWWAGASSPRSPALADYCKRSSTTTTTSKRTRVLPKHEIRTLRSHVRTLERELGCLQFRRQCAQQKYRVGLLQSAPETTRTYTVTNSMWREVAARQQYHRQQVQRENDKLREMLQNQRKLGTALMRLVARDSQTKTNRWQPPTRDYRIEKLDPHATLPCADLFARVDELYGRLPEVFAAPRFRDPSPFVDTRITGSTPNQTAISAQVKLFMPFAPHLVERAAWSVFLKEGGPKDVSMDADVVAADQSFACTFTASSEATRLRVDGKVAAKQFPSTPDNMASAMILAMTATVHGSGHGDEIAVEEEMWFRVERAEATDGAAKPALTGLPTDGSGMSCIQACVHFRLQYNGDDLLDGRQRLQKTAGIICHRGKEELRWKQALVEKIILQAQCSR